MAFTEPTLPLIHPRTVQQFKFRSGTHGLNVGMEVERNVHVLRVVLSVRAWCMCCGSVRVMVVVELV